MSDGFLLVEALMAMAISAFLLVALASTVSLLLRASDRSTRLGQQIEETNRVVDSLAREIESMAPYRWAGARSGFAFSGTRDTLMFGRERRTADGRGVSQLVLLTAVDKPLQSQLFRAEATLPPAAVDPTVLASAEPQEFYRGDYAIRFAYFALLDDGREALVDAWRLKDELPVAIRISMVDRRGSVHASLRVPLLINAEPGCAAVGKAVCRYYKPQDNSEDARDPVDDVIDPDDPFGWMRYAR